LVVLSAAVSLAVTLVRADPYDPSPPQGFDLRPNSSTTVSPPTTSGDSPSVTSAVPGAIDEQYPDVVPPEREPVPQFPVSSGRLEDVLAAANASVPVRLVIPALGIDAPIVRVGSRNGEMEVPATASEVAWYGPGPRPGEQGSAVLAAHVAWQKRNGVFWNLRDLPPGAAIEVWFDSGAVHRFEAVALEAYPKSDLPSGEIFRRTGEPVLTLITCGGAFNPSIGRFTDNVVAYAVEVEGPAR
jgi:sortase (surface protein transpeptidase)